MPLWAVIEILFASAALPSAPVQDCRSIPDPQARLACYDARDGGPIAQPAARSPAPAATPAAAEPTAAAVAVPTTAAVAVPTTPAAPSKLASSPSAAPVLTARPATDAEIVRADPTGQITAVTPLRHGLYRIQLDDGRQFDTTSNMSAPPEVGEKVSLRRTAMGTTFLDVRGRSPITVRLMRQYR